jgi:hypothetical protein
MTRNALTDLYLQESTQRGPLPDELVALARGHVPNLAATMYHGECLSRPVLLAADEHAVLTRDLVNLHASITALPDRLFGGDLAAFARAVGMTDAQVTGILRSRGDAPTRLGRADLYHDGAAFRLLELNMGSTVGNMDNALLNRAMLTHPFIAEFTVQHGLTFSDTMAELANTLLTECKVPSGERPLVAAADWPDSFVTLEPQLRSSAAQLAPLGIDIVPCHLGQLSIKDGLVWLDGRKVDLLYRIFMVEDLLDPRAPELIDPVLLAAERGAVRIFTPLDAELYGSKGALAMLSDEENRGLFSADELASLDRILPWTRMVRPGDVTVAGERVELREYALARREELILKPTLLHGGSGVLPGWLTEPAEWVSRVDAAMDGPFVLQQRIRPEPEPFLTEQGPRPHVLNWGVFLCARGYGGAQVRGTTDLTGGVINMTSGSTATCCFHQVS